MQTLVLTIPEFFARFPSPPGMTDEALPRGADGMVVCVLDRDADDARLLGYWPIWTAIHLDGLWVDTSAEGPAAGALRSLLQGLFATLDHNGVGTAFAILAEGTLSHEQAARLGFQRAPGDLYFLRRS